MPDTRSMCDRMAEAVWVARMSGAVPVRIWLTAADVGRLCVDAGVMQRPKRPRYMGLPVSQCGAGCISRVVGADGRSVTI